MTDGTSYLAFLMSTEEAQMVDVELEMKAQTNQSRHRDSMGLTQSVNFPTHISPNGKSSLLDLVMTIFPTNVSCTSSAPIGSSHHVLVKVNISLDVLRELPQRRRVCNFTQADWQGRQASISL